ncbi:MAG: cbb3-type cytochrome oxidase assembly protein CcoS [Pseudomonadota bacterium]|nr:cbb3-type cytochrome oxidase assembly protein CcoS [Pseudomonadota bacterium]
MDIIYALVPLSIILIGLAVLVFFWAVRSGQFEDLDSPAHRILFDDDDLPRPDKKDAEADATQDDQSGAGKP